MSQLLFVFKYDIGRLGSRKRFMEAKQCSAVFKPRNFQREERVVCGAEISHYMAVGCISARETWLE
jgi:hypothetical protein